MGIFPSGLGPWADRLLPASFRGVPFVVREAQVIKGRRVVVHEYPQKDTVYVEDLGRGKRSYVFRGFLIGDDVYDQRDAFDEAAELPGPGSLIHPSLGSISASLVAYASSESTERGRVVELDLTFVESGTQIFPSLLAATQATVTTQANALLAATQADFAASTAKALGPGSAVSVPGAIGAIALFGLEAQGFVADPSLAVRAVNGLAPPPFQIYGRYSAGSLVTLQPPAATAASLLAAAGVQQAAALAAIFAANELASDL